MTDEVRQEDREARSISRGAPLVPTVGAITLAAMGLTAMVFGHEERVRKSRAVITHTHSEAPKGKRARRRAKARATLNGEKKDG